MEHILSLSYGKDSLACLGAIKKLGLPLDRIIHAEIWATDTIPADLPPMIEFKEKADKIMATFELTDRKNDRAKQLSGGWQRKLSIAMALISNPKILFLDEPTIGLDVRARRELWGTMEKLKGKLTLILTTHYLEEAEELADRICIMDKGIVQVLGTADEIIKVSGARNFEEAFLMYTERGTEL